MKIADVRADAERLENMLLIFIEHQIDMDEVAINQATLLAAIQTFRERLAKPSAIELMEQHRLYADKRGGDTDGLLGWAVCTVSKHNPGLSPFDKNRPEGYQPPLVRSGIGVTLEDAVYACVESIGAVPIGPTK